MKNDLLRQVSALAADEQIELVAAIWDGLVARQEALPLTAAESAELDSRLADHQENPDDVIDWEDVKAAALGKTAK